MKQEWRKPILTIVAKSTTEETVLVMCKSRDFWPDPMQGPNAGWCGYPHPNPDPSGDGCNAAVPS